MQIDPQLREEVEEVEEISDDEERQLGYNPQLGGHYDPELGHDRKQEKSKLRGRFEQIFEKYERDFEGIGDEIDLKTGTIVVDNGHLKNMQHEVDIGDSASGEFTQASTENLETEDSSGETGSDDEDEEFDDRDSTPAETSNGDFSAPHQTEDSMTSLSEENDSTQKLDPRLREPNAQLDAQSLPRKILVDPRRSREESVAASSGSNAAPDNIFDQLPTLRDSMLDVQSKYKNGQGMDQDAIQALGMSIANQLATFVSGGKKKSLKRKHEASSVDPAWSHPELPGLAERPQAKRRPRSRSLSPWPEPPKKSPGQQSIWAPLKRPKARKKQQLGYLLVQAAHQAVDDSLSVTADNEDAQHLQERNQNDGARKCYHCQTSNSFVWRNGQDGVLCNACGMYHYRYGLLRPLEPLSETEVESDSDVDTQGDRPPHSAKTSARSIRFALEEDAQLIKLKEIDCVSWERIASHFPGRTAYAVQCRYSKKLLRQKHEARYTLVNQGHRFEENANGVPSFAARSKDFAEEEDELLLKLRDEDGLDDWEVVARSFLGRSAQILERRFHELEKHCRDGKPKRKAKRVLDPTTRMFYRYSAEEDELIVKLREVDKLSWSALAQRFPGRNVIALQKRYVREQAKKKQKQTETNGAEAPVGEASTMIDSSGVGSGSLKGVRYTAEEDSLLIQLRDVQQLSWGEIAEKIPGKTLESLSNRYRYNQIKGQVDRDEDGGAESDDEMPTRSLEQSPAGDDAMPKTYPMPQKQSVKRRYRWTQDESDLLATLRAEGKTWDEIARRVPRRSAQSIQNFYRKNLSKIKTCMSLPAHKTETTLLRQAVGNNLQRRSESALPIDNVYSAPLDCATDGDCDENSIQSSRPASVVGDDQSCEDGQLLPSALPRDANDPFLPSGLSSGKLRPVQRVSSHPFESKSVSATTPSADGPSALVEYLSGNFQSPIQSRDEKDRTSMYPETPLRQAGVWQCDVGPTPGATTEYLTPARYNQQAHPYYVVPPPPTYIRSLDKQSPGEKAVVDLGLDGEKKDAPKRVEANSKRRRAPIALRSKREARHQGEDVRRLEADMSVDEPRVDDADFVVYEEPVGDDATVDADETEPDDETLDVDETMDDGETIDDNELREPESDGEPDEEALGVEHDDKPKREKQRDETTFDVSRRNEDADDLKPPRYVWTDLITMALKSNAPKPMRTREVQKYVEDTFPYFKHHSGWKNSIRSHLSSRPEFEKVSNDFAAFWALKDPNEAVVGSERPRRKPGRPRTRPLPSGPPRKRGRPPKDTKLPQKSAMKRSKTTRKSRDAYDPEFVVSGDDGNVTSHEDDEESDCDPTVSESEEEPMPPVTSESDDEGPPSSVVMISEDEDLRFSDLREPVNLQSENQAVASDNSDISKVDTEQQPVGFTKQISSDIRRDPETSLHTLDAHERHCKGERTFQADDSEVSITAQEMPSSSSPFLMMKKPSHPNVYNRTATPGTGRSALFSHLLPLASSGLKPSLDGFSGVSRSSSVARFGSVKRVVHTPIRDADGSEDELAI